MTFAECAARLCGQCALLLGWRPEEFWQATPAELGCVLAAMAIGTGESMDASQLANLMEQFPDG